MDRISFNPLDLVTEEMREASWQVHRQKYQKEEISM